MSVHARGLIDCHLNSIRNSKGFIPFFSLHGKCLQHIAYFDDGFYIPTCRLCAKFQRCFRDKISHQLDTGFLHCRIGTCVEFSETVLYTGLFSFHMGSRVGT